MAVLDSSIDPERIPEAASLIDPVFKDTPQFLCEPMAHELGVEVVLKVECVNPIRSFKGRGADYLLHRLGPQGGSIVCASAGNFGQGMAYACRREGRPLTVFAAQTANPLKLERMRALGATVVVGGTDFDAAKELARHHATQTNELYVEDGLWGPIAEGAGTIGLELSRVAPPIDVVVLPLGNGALANGVGAWIKRYQPKTRVIAVAAVAAPAMALSWRSSTVVVAPIETVADGIAVRVPIPEALEHMRRTVDEVMLVSDDLMLDAMRLAFKHAGVIVEPAGAAGLAAIMQRASDLAGLRVATPLCGGNLTPDQVHRWLY